MVQGKWTRELSGWNLIKDPAPKLLQPAQQKSQMTTAANRVKGSWQDKQARRRWFANLPDAICKTLGSDFFLNANTVSTEHYRAEGWGKKAIGIGSWKLKGRQLCHISWEKVSLASSLLSQRIPEISFTKEERPSLLHGEFASASRLSGTHRGRMPRIWTQLAPGFLTSQS